MCFHFHREIVKRLVYSMVQFLQSQLESGANGGGLTEEGVESVEVAVQCLETAYGVSLAQNDLAVPKSLYQIFSEAVRGEMVSSKTFNWMELKTTVSLKADIGLK